MSFQLGQIVGDYEFVDILRSSKTNVAYKVKNVLAQRFEILKIVPGDLHHDPERLERFQREIKIHARLDHPNILAFYNATVLQGNLVMTTAYVEGVSLEERLELGPLPWRQAVDIAMQLLSALGLAHSQGVVHREVTPANILLTGDDRAILTGFGQAKTAQDPRLTQKGAVVGSLFYMSPEQVKGGDHLDATSDIYSIGAVLFEMVTGRRMFSGKSHFDIMVAHVNQAPPDPAALVPDLPAELSPVILQAVAKDPAARYSSTEALRSALKSISDSQGSASGAGAASRTGTTISPVGVRPQPAVERRAERPQAAAASASRQQAGAAVATPPAPDVAATSPRETRVQVPMAPPAAGPASPTGPATQQKVGEKPQISPEMGAEFAENDRKALVVLVCTLLFLLITTVVMSKLG